MPIGYLLKKAVAKIFFPLPICLLFLVAGLILLVFTWRKKTGTTLVAVGTLLLFLFSTDFMASGLLRPLEYHHAPHRPTATGPEAGYPGAPWICVLGSGWTAEERLPVPSRPDRPFLNRLLEGSRLARLYPEASVAVVIATEADPELKRKFLREWAEIMQLDPARFTLIHDVRDTVTEAKAIRELVGEHKIILVTSASHMPRALQIIARYGLDAEPAPCGHRTLPRYRNNFHGDYIYPYSNNVSRCEKALYEYMGLAWERFKVLIGKG